MKKIFKNYLKKKSQFEREKATFLSGELTFYARSNVFIEGIAQLRIAKRRGFTVQKEYEFCPSIAMIDNEVENPKDIFHKIEKLV